MPSPAVRAAALFRRTFGREPAALASAPGRVNLIGEHVDYHGGHVLPVATAERTAVAVGPPSAPGRLRAVSENGDQFSPVDDAWPPLRSGRWWDYVAGAARFASEGFGSGFAIAVASDLAVGAGVSSSAAIGVATAAAVKAAAGAPASPDDLAAIAYRSEREHVGVPCGRMDQLASAATPPRQALLIDCATLQRSPVDVPVDLVLADSGQRHALRQGDGGYAQRVREGGEAVRLIGLRWPALTRLLDIPPARLTEVSGVLTPVLARRVRHVVNENQRTRLAARALQSGDPEGFGVLVNASHASLRDLYECSTPRLDAIAATAQQLQHVLGARMVGGGWGGAVLVVCESGAGGVVAARLRGDSALSLPDVRTVVPGEGVRVEPRAAP
jgi:galactokinase